MTNDKQAVLGEGVLNWSRYERIGDRYGCVHLTHTPWGENFITWTDVPTGRRGRLTAVILETRESSHIGDIALGVGPSKPSVGEEVNLGTGTLFAEMDDGVPVVGLKPDDGREKHWLDVPGLYRCHNQTVRLVFTQEEA